MIQLDSQSHLGIKKHEFIDFSRKTFMKSVVFMEGMFNFLQVVCFSMF